MIRYVLYFALVLNLIYSTNASNVTVFENKGLFRILCKGSIFTYNGQEVNGFHQIELSKGRDIERFESTIWPKHRSNLDKGYLVKEVIFFSISLSNIQTNIFSFENHLIITVRWYYIRCSRPIK